MNLFETFEKNTKFMSEAQVSAERINGWLRDSVNNGYNTPSLSNRSITSCQTAVIISYAGNPDSILTDAEYTQFHSLLSKMQTGINQRLKVEPTTTKIANSIMKAGGQLL